MGNERKSHGMDLPFGWRAFAKLAPVRQHACACALGKDGPHLRHGEPADRITLVHNDGETTNFCGWVQRSMRAPDTQWRSMHDIAVGKVGRIHDGGRANAVASKLSE
jgi:hypothetical protein